MPTANTVFWAKNVKFVDDKTLIHTVFAVGIGAAASDTPTIDIIL